MAGELAVASVGTLGIVSPGLLRDAGLTTPILTRVPYRNVPRPIFPVARGITRLSITSKIMSPLRVPPQ